MLILFNLFQQSVSHGSMLRSGLSMPFSNCLISNSLREGDGNVRFPFLYSALLQMGETEDIRKEGTTEFSL